MVDVEMLIEEIRKFPVLYDQTSEKYRNSEYKDRIWNNISTTLAVKGGIEECKKKWSSVRDQFRRTLQKRKTASGQAAVNNRKYKYEDILEFLLPHISERDTLSNVDDFEEDQNNEMEITNNETSEEFSGQPCEQQNNRDRSDKSITEIQNNFTDSVDDTLRSTTETLAKSSSLSVKKNTFRPPLKRKIIHGGTTIDSPASQLMAFMLAEKEEENKKSKKEVESTVKHPIDAFLSGILKPTETAEARRKTAWAARTSYGQGTDMCAFVNDD
ncbi:uncharacterized protein LOC111026827 [Myzus persicae]|uniref:uncharacterized protein LOC111026827 n=1 Tax=Myzus persicae TaxID=13164 RepID=UPI000B933D37|nr:uncharacterized protein LOC111026827 [Myzus persicae]